MTHTEKRQLDLWEFLVKRALGAGNAMKNAQIAETLGYPDRGSAGRAGIRNSHLLTADINALRSLGYPICADHTGIFYAEYKHEVQPTLKDYTHRAEVFAAQAQALEFAAAVLPVAA